MLGNLDGVLQLVGDGGNESVADGVLRVDFHADVPVVLGSNHRNQTRSNPSTCTHARLHQHNDVLLLERVDESAKGWRSLVSLPHELVAYPFVDRTVGYSIRLPGPTTASCA